MGFCWESGTGGQWGNVTLDKELCGQMNNGHVDNVALENGTIGQSERGTIDNGTMGQWTNEQ